MPEPLAAKSLEPPTLRPRRRVSLSVAMAIVLLASGMLIARQLVLQFDAVRAQVRALRIDNLVLPFVATLLAIGVDSICFHRAILACMGGRSRLRFVESFAVLNASTVSKYLPGKVWAYGVQAAVLHERGIPVMATLHANVTIMAAAVTAAGWLLAIGALFIPNRALGIALAAAVTGLLAAVHIFYGRAVVVVVRLIRHVLRRDLPLDLVPRRNYLALVLYYVGNLVLLGASGAFLLAALQGPLTAGQFVAVTVVTAVSWLAGYAAFFVPAGLGVRETAMVALLGKVGIAGSVVLVPLVTRLLLIAGEALFGAAGAAALWCLAHRRDSVLPRLPR